MKGGLTDTSTPDSGRLPAALCHPQARRVGPKMWAEFCDWWTGWRGKDKFQSRDEAWFLFVIGHACGNAQAIPLQMVCERILTWWRCDGDLDRLGDIMDGLERIVEAQPNDQAQTTPAAGNSTNTTNERTN